jgi:hypothetical protein
MKENRIKKFNENSELNVISSKNHLTKDEILSTGVLYMNLLMGGLSVVK